MHVSVILVPKTEIKFFRFQIFGTAEFRLWASEFIHFSHWDMSLMSTDGIYLKESFLKIWPLSGFSPYFFFYDILSICTLNVLSYYGLSYVYSIFAENTGFLGELTPNKVRCHCNPQKHIFASENAAWAIRHRNRITHSSCEHVGEVKKWKKKTSKAAISTYWESISLKRLRLNLACCMRHSARASTVPVGHGVFSQQPLKFCLSHWKLTSSTQHNRAKTCRSMIVIIMIIHVITIYRGRSCLWWWHRHFGPNRHSNAQASCNFAWI